MTWKPQHRASFAFLSAASSPHTCAYLVQPIFHRLCVKNMNTCTDCIPPYSTRGAFCLLVVLTRHRSSKRLFIFPAVLSRFARLMLRKQRRGKRRLGAARKRVDLPCRSIILAFDFSNLDCDDQYLLVVVLAALCSSAILGQLHCSIMLRTPGDICSGACCSSLRDAAAIA